MAHARRNEDTFMFDRAAETMARDELEALQLHRLKQTIARAYAKVPPFRRKLDAAGVRPDDLKTLADIARFPFTVKADLRDNFPFGLFAVPREELLRLHASSGTTGKPTVGGFGAEPWSDTMRRELEEKFAIKAMDIYGLSEIIGPGVASECHQAQHGLHLWEDHFLCEVIDPDTTEPLPLGEAGELVLTTLTKEALPMLRYRTRDITRLIEAPCACGRTHRRLLRVTGRSDDMLIIRGVNVYPSQLEAFLVGFPGLAPHYELVLTRDRPLDAITIEVELATPAPRDEPFAAKIAADLRKHIKAIVGVSCGVVLKAPGEVPRSQGKAVRVKDLRQANKP